MLHCLSLALRFVLSTQLKTASCVMPQLLICAKGNETTGNTSPSRCRVGGKLDEDYLDDLRDFCINVNQWTTADQGERE